MYLLLKALISGCVIAAASEVARRSPGWGGLIVSLPLVSLLSFVWLWLDTGDAGRVGELARSALWFFLPSVPLFLALPALLRAGVGFWPAFGVSVLGTAVLYALFLQLAPRLGVPV